MLEGASTEIARRCAPGRSVGGCASDWVAASRPPQRPPYGPSLFRAAHSIAWPRRRLRESLGHTSQAPAPKPGRLRWHCRDLNPARGAPALTGVHRGAKPGSFPGSPPRWPPAVRSGHRSQQSDRTAVKRRGRGYQARAEMPGPVPFLGYRCSRSGKGSRVGPVLPAIGRGGAHVGTTSPPSGVLRFPYQGVRLPVNATDHEAGRDARGRGPRPRMRPAEKHCRPDSRLTPAVGVGWGFLPSDRNPATPVRLAGPVDGDAGTENAPSAGTGESPGQSPTS